MMMLLQWPWPSISPLRNQTPGATYLTWLGSASERVAKNAATASAANRTRKTARRFKVHPTFRLSGSISDLAAVVECRELLGVGAPGMDPLNDFERERIQTIRNAI